MSINNNEVVDEPTIGQFYAGKNVFVTGGTGFIGTVLIEALLSTTPKIGNIYLLVREKYGSDTNERVKRLLSKQVIAISSYTMLKGSDSATITHVYFKCNCRFSKIIQKKH